MSSKEAGWECKQANKGCKIGRMGLRRPAKSSKEAGCENKKICKGCKMCRRGIRRPAKGLI